MNVHSPCSRRVRTCGSGHAHDITGSSWNDAVSTAATLSTSPPWAVRIESSATAQDRSQVKIDTPPGPTRKPTMISTIP